MPRLLQLRKQILDNGIEIEKVSLLKILMKWELASGQMFVTFEDLPNPYEFSIGVLNQLTFSNDG